MGLEYSIYDLRQVVIHLNLYGRYCMNHHDLR
nr:MAG TPA: hypothetical protein [Caudoviricetes sp.]DAV73913.1 MAG TPA: hypothetical protein [Bacteriophage sp.]